MSFNRNLDDPTAYKINVQDSVAQGDYQLSSVFHTPMDTCVPFARGTLLNYSIADIVDDSSELRGDTRKLSKDPKDMFPFTQQPLTFKTDVSCEPEHFTESRYSQLTADENKTDINLTRIRDAGLAEDPQALDKIQSNSRNGLNTRLYFRDAFTQ